MVGSLQDLGFSPEESCPGNSRWWSPTEEAPLSVNGET
jgi:hypothetical protein